MVLPTARKPEGGFQFISVMQLCALWTAYETRSIRLFDVRVWCTAQEVIARRCQCTPGQQPMFRSEEWTVLLSRRGGLTASFIRLQQAELLSWDGTAFTFSSPVIEANASLMTMLTRIPNHHRRIPVPRRLLRFLAKGCSRVLLATILGHLFRCLYYRQGQCRSEGFCKASWIAEVFGVSTRAVKTARQRLETLGFLQRTDTPQWVRNRYGQKMAINLRWEGGTTAVATISASLPPLAPPQAEEIAQPAPLDSHKELPTELKYQKPASSGSPGVLSTLFAQARECLRNGTSLIDELPLMPQLSPTVRTIKQASTPTRKTLPAFPPNLHHVCLPDLQEMERLLTLYTQAVQTHLIAKSEADRLAFVALAHHVVAFRPTNPGGLFLHLLRQRQFHLITQAEEELAQQRLKRHDFATSWPASLCAMG